MRSDLFIEKQLRLKLPNVTQSAIDAALIHYKRSQGSAKGKVFDECLKIAKDYMIKVK